MAGAFIKVTVRDTGVMAALKRVAAADKTLIVPWLKGAGEVMVRGVRERFSAERAPDGSKWKALNADYAASKTRSTKILQASGTLFGSIVWQLQGTRTVAIGTNRVYAAIHQFGGTIVPRTADSLVFKIGGALVHASKVTVPARPYLGVSSTDRTRLVELAEDLISTDWGRSR